MDHQLHVCTYNCISLKGNKSTFDEMGLIKSNNFQQQSYFERHRLTRFFLENGHRKSIDYTNLETE